MRGSARVQVRSISLSEVAHETLWKSMYPSICCDRYGTRAPTVHGLHQAASMHLCCPQLPVSASLREYNWGLTRPSQVLTLSSLWSLSLSLWLSYVMVWFCEVEEQKGNRKISSRSCRLLQNKQYLWIPLVHVSSQETINSAFKSVVPSNTPFLLIWWSPQSATLGHCELKIDFNQCCHWINGGLLPPEGALAMKLFPQGSVVSPAFIIQPANAP